MFFRKNFQNFIIWLKDHLWAQLQKLFFKHIALTMFVIFVIGNLFVFIFLWYETKKLNEFSALREAKQFSKVLTIFRTMYTAKVVNRAKSHGMEVVHNYQKKKNAIPLPATLSIELGNKIGSEKSGVKAFLYSPYPFPWRKKTGGLRDVFQKAAWKNLKKFSSHPFYQFGDYQGVYSLRYATADVMRESCLHCHNTHLQTPKNNWQKDDLRGVLEIILPLDAIVLKTNIELFVMFAFITFIVGLGFIGLTLIIKTLYRNSLKLKQGTKELELAKENADIANKAKSDFVANMSHEIRTPLNVIAGTIYIVSQTPLTTKQKDYLNKMQFACGTLLKIVNDVLDFSKMEANKLDIKNVAFDFYQLVDNLVDMMSIGAQEKNITLTSSIDSNIPQQLLGSPLRLEQVLLNLISNAIKFTDSGNINVAVNAKLIEKESIMLKFSIEDSGIGISEKQISKLFQSFSQIDTSTKRKYGGTGLGLSICKSLVSMMGGEINVKSDISKGSTFFFTAKFGYVEKEEIIPTSLAVEGHKIKHLGPKKSEMPQNFETNKEKRNKVDMAIVEPLLIKLKKAINDYDTEGISLSMLLNEHLDILDFKEMQQLQKCLKNYDFENALLHLLNIANQLELSLDENGNGALRED